MSNRIESFFSTPTLSGQTQAAPVLAVSQLTLTMDRPFKVDMERFFEFSFSFAEALVDLEDRHTPPTKITTLERFHALEAEASCEEFGDIDARWM